LGSCPKCKKHELVLVTLRNKKRFVSCNGRNSKSCDVTLPITQKGRIYKTGKTCPHCGYPIVKRVSRGKSPWIFCVNWSKCPGNAGRKTSGDNK
ncbi:DNA topoisomerase I, partial [Candidatus Bathyarchaeota archaeon]|nr:DNA topoisomerase I [Candidatus Bathyarchaeota archaeon]